MATSRFQRLGCSRACGAVERRAGQFGAPTPRPEIETYEMRSGDESIRHGTSVVVGVDAHCDRVRLRLNHCGPRVSWIFRRSLRGRTYSSPQRGSAGGTSRSWLNRRFVPTLSRLSAQPPSSSRSTHLLADSSHGGGRVHSSRDSRSGRSDRHAARRRPSASRDWASERWGLGTACFELGLVSEGSTGKGERRVAYCLQ